MNTEQHDPWDDFPPGGFHASSDLIKAMADIAAAGAGHGAYKQLEADIKHEEQQFIRKVPVHGKTES